MTVDRGIAVGERRIVGVDAILGTHVVVPINDEGRYRLDLDIERWDAEQTDWARSKSGLLAPTAKHFLDLGIEPYRHDHLERNLLTTVGGARLTNLLTGGGGIAITNTTARIGVGNGAGTAAVGDTDLSAAAGSGNRWFLIMDATFPTVSNFVLTLKSTFASADGNFAWNEFGVDISAATVASSAVVGTTLFNHKTSIAQGTKASGQTWAATATITFS